MVMRPIFQAVVLAASGAAATFSCGQILSAQEHAHGAHAHSAHAGHGSAAEGKEPMERPTIFLDKSPRVVAYQLKRLDNTRLLLVERFDTDVKYAPIYLAILTRAGMSPQYREEAVAALAKLNQSDAVNVLLSALAEVDDSDRQTRRTADQLSRLLLALPANVLAEHADDLAAAAVEEAAVVRKAGFAGLIVAGEQDRAAAIADADSDAMVDFLLSVPLVPKTNDRNAMRSLVIAQVSHLDPAVQQAAIRALGAITADRKQTFKQLAPLFTNADVRDSVVQTLLTIPADQRDPQAGAKLLADLAQFAEQTPAAKRTEDFFIDAMQLAVESLATVSPEQSRIYRDRLRAVAVRAVRIRTVEEEMRYDTPYFAVEAGRPVQVVLDNEDLMPHNFVLTVPGALKEVAQLGLKVGPDGGLDGKQYVPESELVLQATDMVPAGTQVRLTFDAPAEPGEYPYVCTFPQHWQRMYGVMIVVEDLDEWLRNPVPPTDPIGSNRSFVQSWQVSDLADSLEDGMRGRSPEIGMRIFKEASCANCHQVGGQGGAVGPALDDVFGRWKGDAKAVLQEILEPSHRIDAKYAMHVVLTLEGKTVSGLIVEENKDEVLLLENPEALKPTVISQDDIEEIVKTSTSMMPKALLDQYTQDEVLELMAYLKGLAEKKPAE